MSSKLNRRSFLQKSAGAIPGTMLSVGALEQMMMMVVQGLYSKAYAEVSGVLPRNYIQLHMSGAPPRWVFDSFLITKASDRTDRYVANPAVGNVFLRDGSNNITGLDYKTYNYNGIETPWLWKYNVATSNGSVRPMSDLLDNMAVIRGYTSLVDGHEINQPKQTYPEPSGVSIIGAVADKSIYPMPAVVAPSMNWFKSASGASAMSVNIASGVNSISLLRKAFDYTSIKATSTSLQKKDQYETLITRATDALKYLIRGSGDKADVLKKNLGNADTIIKAAAEDLTAIWNAGMQKYSTAIDNSVNPAILYPSGIPGITDLPVTCPAMANPTVYRLEGRLIPDAGGTRPGNLILPAGTDLRRPFTEAINASTKQTIATFAQTLTLAEYILSKGMSNSLATVLPFESLTNLNYKIANTVVAQGNTALNGSESVYLGKASASNDEHLSGSYASLLAFSCFYRGIAAGLLEFTETLKRTTVNGKNLFSETVIHLTGDFGRSPIKTGFGSDHGFWGHNTAVISGAFNNGPVVTGNIQVQDIGPNFNQSPTYNYMGTWGATAKVQFGSEREYLGLKHMTASVAHLLRLDPNPWPFNNRVWSLSGSNLVGVTPVNIKATER
ncbi:MAG: hypothetical protein ACOYOK_08655 [Pseudobdellovibrionaceae bacterium]